MQTRLHTKLLVVAEVRLRAHVAKSRIELEETTKLVIEGLVEPVFLGSHRLKQVQGGAQNGKEWVEGCDGDIMSHFNNTLASFDTKIIAREVLNVRQVLSLYIYL